MIRKDRCVSKLPHSSQVNPFIVASVCSARLGDPSFQPFRIANLANLGACGAANRVFLMLAAMIYYVPFRQPYLDPQLAHYRNRECAIGRLEASCLGVLLLY